VDQVSVSCCFFERTKVLLAPGYQAIVMASTGSSGPDIDGSTGPPGPRPWDSCRPGWLGAAVPCRGWKSGWIQAASPASAVPGLDARLPLSLCFCPRRGEKKTPKNKDGIVGGGAEERALVPWGCNPVFNRDLVHLHTSVTSSPFLWPLLTCDLGHVPWGPGGL
jgi:hypothetical protein